MKGLNLKAPRSVVDETAEPPNPTDVLDNGPTGDDGPPVKGNAPEAIAPPEANADLPPVSFSELQKNYVGVAKTDPDRAAKVIEFARKLNEPESFVDKNLPDIQKQPDPPPPTFFQGIDSNHPKTAQWLSDPKNMVVSHDDLPNVVKHDQLVAGITQARNLTDSLKAGWQGSVTGLNARDQMPDTVMAEDAPWYNKFASMAAEMVGDFPAMVAAGAPGFAAGSSAAASTVGLAAPLLGPAAIPAVAAAGLVGGTMSAGAAAFAAPALYKSLFKQHFEKGDIESIKDLVDRSGTALKEASKQGLVGAFTAGVGLVAPPLAVLGSNKIFGETAGLAADSLSKKAFQKAVPLLAEDIAMTESGNAVEGKKTTAEDYLNNTLQMLAMHGATHLAPSAIESYVEAKRTEQAAQFYTSLGDSAATSKLLARMPEGYQSMLGNLAKDSPVENVFIPHEAFTTYFQSKGLDPETVAADLGVSDSYNEASKVTGSDVQIPIADWVTKVVKSEHYKGLQNDVKFDPEGLTVNQIEQHQSEVQEQMKALEASRETETTPEKEQAADISEKIATQLEATGMSPEDAATNAKIHEKFFSTMAERTGKSPEELFDKYQLSINGKDADLAPSDGAQSLKQVSNSEPENGERVLEQAGDDSSARGQIRIGQNRQIKIDLLKNADLSTFLHETGHFYMEVMGDLAGDEKAPQQIKDDFSTVLNWLGVDSREGIQTEHHEKWARGFESYLMDGKAPSSALKETFGRIRDWLINIYRHMKNLNVDLSPEVKGVMDRMLASDDEIRQVAKDIGYDEKFDQGQSPEVTKHVTELQERARQVAMDSLLKEQMPEMKSERKEFLNKEREKLAAKAEQRVREQVPVFKAQDELKSGGHNDPVDLAQKFLAGTLDDKTQGDFHAIAEVHGFASGDDLAKQIVDAQASDQFKNEVQGRVEAGMRQHAGLMDPDKLKAEAMKAIHNEKSTELLALEQQILQQLTEKKDIRGEVTKRKRLEASIAARAAKEQAVEILSGKPIKDASNSRVYVTAERNAAAKAAAAIAKKDYDKAAKFKKQQLFNHALAAEAMRNNEEAGKAVDYLDSMTKRGKDLKDMPYGFTRQVDQVLSKFGFMEERQEDFITNAKNARVMAEAGQDPAEIANSTGLVEDDSGKWIPEDLPSFVERVNKNYRAMLLHDSVTDNMGKDFKSLTMQELRDVKDTIKTISKIGKTYDRYLEEYRTMDIRSAAKALRSSVEENFGKPFEKHLAPGSTYQTKMSERLGNITQFPNAIKRYLDTMLTTCDKLDGHKEGPAKDNIYRPLAAAQDRESARNYKMAQEVEEIYAKHYTEEEFRSYKDQRVNIDGRNFTKENILCMALNWGNETNRDRVMKGFNFDEAKMDRIFDQHLEKKDWDFAQDTWKHINDSYWSDLAKLEMETKGLQAEKVQPSPFTNKHGSYEGGYYPIAYDYDKSIRANQSMVEANDLWAQGSTAGAQTARGHAESRQATVKQPVRLSLDVLTRHHENMVHDLEFRRPVIDVNRFMNQSDVKAALQNAVGIQGYTGMVDWLKSAARNVSEPMSPFDQAAQWFRFKTTMYMMGFRIASGLKIGVENQINVAREVGLSEAAKSLKDYYLGDSGLHEVVVGKSEYMRQRATHLDRDQADIANKWRGTGQAGFQKYAFFVHAFLDQGASFPLWNNVYQRMLGEHGEEKLAITQADEAVKKSFMTGGRVDQPAVMRGPELMKAMTVAYGYTSSMWNAFSRQMSQADMAIAQGNNLDAASVMAKSTIYMFLLPALTKALASEFVRNSPPNSNPDDRKKRIAANMMEEMTPLKFVPVARDIAPSLIKMAMGERTNDLQFSPLESAAETLFKPLAETPRAMMAAFGHAQAPEHFAEHAANAVSLAAGIPKQANDIIFNMLDWTKDNGHPALLDAFSRKTKK